MGWGGDRGRAAFYPCFITMLEQPRAGDFSVLCLHYPVCKVGIWPQSLPLHKPLWEVRRPVQVPSLLCSRTQGSG